MSNGAFIYYSMTLLGSWGGATFVSDVIIFRTSFGVGACLFLFGTPCKGSEKTSMIKAGSVQWGWGGGVGGQGRIWGNRKYDVVSPLSPPRVIINESFLYSKL